MHRCYQFRPDWKVNAFMVDDALAENFALIFYKYHTKDELNLAGGSQSVKRSYVFGMYDEHG